MDTALLCGHVFHMLDSDQDRSLVHNCFDRCGWPHSWCCCRMDANSSVCCDDGLFEQPECNVPLQETFEMEQSCVSVYQLFMKLSKGDRCVTRMN